MCQVAEGNVEYEENKQKEEKTSQSLFSPWSILNSGFQSVWCFKPVSKVTV